MAAPLTNAGRAAGMAVSFFSFPRTRLVSTVALASTVQGSGGVSEACSGSVGDGGSVGSRGPTTWDGSCTRVPSTASAKLAQRGELEQYRPERPVGVPDQERLFEPKQQSGLSCCLEFRWSC